MADEKVGGIYIEVTARKAKGEPGKTIQQLKKEAKAEGPVDIGVQLSENTTRERLVKLVKKLQGEKVDIDTNLVGFNDQTLRLTQWVKSLAKEQAEVAVSAQLTGSEKVAAQLKRLRESVTGKTAQFTAELTGDATVRERLARLRESARGTVARFTAALTGENGVRARLERINSEFKNRIVNFTAALTGENSLRARLARLKTEFKAGNKIYFSTSLLGEKGVLAKVIRLRQQVKENAVKFNAKLTGESAFMAKLKSLTALANSKLDWVSRTRIAEIHARVNNKQILRARNIIANAFGGGVMQHSIQSITQLTSHLDESALAWARMGTKAMGVSAGVVSSIGNIAVAGTQLAGAMGAIGLVAPGILSGFAVGIAGSLDGLQNMHLAIHEAAEELNIMDSYLVQAGNGLKELRTFSLTEAFKEARLEGGENFWAEAKASLGGVITNVLMPFFAEYRGLMTHLGAWWGEFFQGLSNGVSNLGGMSAFFEPLNQSIDIAATAIRPLVESLLQLGLIGGQYLPALAEGFVSVANSFTAWLNKAVETGRIFEIIDSGIQTLKTLGGILAQSFGIFAEVSQIAQDAGYNGLGAFLAALTAIRDAISSGPLRDALVSVFEGARTAMSNVLPGIGSLKEAFITLAPTIQNIFGKVGTIISNVMDGIAKAVQNPAFSEGFTKLFDGIVSATETLQPAFEAIGGKFGELAGLFGTVMESASPLINKIVTALIPAFSELIQAIEPVIPILADAFGNVLDTLLPIIVKVVEGIANFTAEHPKLAAVLVVVVGAISGFISIITSIVGVLMPVIKVLAVVAEVVGGWATLWGGVVSVVSWVISALGGLVAFFTSLPVIITVAIVALVALIILNWDKIVAFTTTAWNAIVEGVTGAVNAVVEWVTSAWSGLVQLVSDVWSNVTTTITTWLQTLWDGIVAWFTGLQEFWTNAWNFVTETVTTIFTGLTEFLTPIFEGIILFFTEKLAFLKMLWDLAWQGLVLVVQTIWTTITTAIQMGLTFAQTIITTAITFITTTWNAGWNLLTSVVSAVFTAVSTVVSTVFGAVRDFIVTTAQNIWNAITTAFTNVRNTVQTVVNAVWTFVQSGFNRALSIVITVAQGIWNAITTAFNNVRNTVQNVINTVKAVIQAGFTIAQNIVRNTVQGIWNAVSSAFNNVLNTVRNVVNSVKSFITNGFNTVVSFVRNFASNVYNSVRNGFQNIVNSVSGTIGRVVSTVAQLPGRALRALGNIGRTLYNSGRSLMIGFLNGITSMIGNIKNKVSGAVAGIRKYFPFSPAKEGPFSGRGYTTYSGQALMSDFGDSIQSAARAQASKVGNAMSAMRSTIGEGELTLPGVQLSSVTVPQSALTSRPATTTGTDTSSTSLGEGRYTDGDIDRIVSAISNMKPIVTISDREFTGLVRQANRNISW